MVFLLLLQIAFSTVVYPSLLLAYLGQAAFLLNYPEHSDNPFYKSLPGKWSHLYLSGLFSVNACIIAKVISLLLGSIPWYVTFWQVQVGSGWYYHRLSHKEIYMELASPMCQGLWGSLGDIEQEPHGVQSYCRRWVLGLTEQRWHFIMSGFPVLEAVSSKTVGNHR